MSDDIRHDDAKLLSDLGAHAGHGPGFPRAELSEVFHENTKLTPTTSRRAADQIAAIAKNTELVRMMARAYKTYSLAEPTPLPDAAPLDLLEQTIAARRSVRRYLGQPISVETVSRLLRFGYGRTQKPGFFRAVASGGALYPLELYACSLRVDGLEPGLYHYDVEHHRLHGFARGDFTQALTDTIHLEDTDLSRACLVVLISAVFARSTLKYGDRGYRMVLMECGEVGQNLSLVATASGIGSVWIGGFLDDGLNDLLGLDGVAESVLMPIVFGVAP
jgi:SagB-type dehydrogenase family enzyme